VEQVLINQMFKTIHWSQHWP